MSGGLDVTVTGTGPLYSLKRTVASDVEISKSANMKKETQMLKSMTPFLFTLSSHQIDD